MNEDITGYDLINVPSCWESLGYGASTYLNMRYQMPANPPKVPNDNPTGVYKRGFYLEDAPENGHRILTFCGVSSAFHVYINGSLAGYSQGSHNMSEFDVTDLCRNGWNSLCVVVYQFCDGSYLEAQDYFRNHGIFRDVYLLTTERAYIRDVWFDPHPTDGSLDRFDIQLRVDIEGDADVQAEMRLYDGDTLVMNGSVTPGARTAFSIERPKLWSAELPYVYDLYILLIAQGRELEAVRLPVGFKHIEIRDGIFFFNGQNIKLRGSNRHDFHYKNGYTMTLQEMEQDILLLKKFNNNCIRTSHYPNDPRFPELCDRYGIYLVAEADLEAHGASWMDNWSWFSENPDWEEAFLDRVSRLVYRDRNHPCIAMWSLGNESGYLRNHRVCYNYVKKVDPKIPVHYEGAIYAPEKGFDVVSRMYPAFNLIKEHLANKDEQPFFLCEYTQGEGCCPGGLQEHWEIIYAHDKAMGGCVWEMTDHSAVVYEQDGRIRYRYGYGGDFGSGIHDGKAGTNGFFDPERRPRNAAYLMKQVYRPVWAKLASQEPMRVEFCNHLDFLDTSGLRVAFQLMRDGVCMESGEVEMPVIPPHGCAQAAVPCAVPAGKGEWFLNLEYRRKEATAYHEADFCVGTEQFPLGGKPVAPAFAPTNEPVTVYENGDVIVRTGDLQVIFDRRYGVIRSLRRNGREFLCTNMRQADMAQYARPVAGPRLCFWRIPLRSDYQAEPDWRRFGYDSLEAHIDSAVCGTQGDAVTFTARADYGAQGIRPVFRVELEHTVHPDGRIDIEYVVNPLRENLPYLPRLGLVMDLPREFDRVRYYGGGPRENYADMQEAAQIGLYEQAVGELGDLDIVPQEMGNRCGVRYCTFLRDGYALTVYAQEPFCMHADHYTLRGIEQAGHIEDLKEQMLTEVHLDSVVAPIGRFFCGYPEDEQRFLVYPDKELRFRFTLAAQVE